MKKKLVIGILAAAALMLSACGTEGGTQPETGSSSSTEQNTQDKKTNDKTVDGSSASSEGEKEDASHKTGKVVEPMATTTDLRELSGDYQVSFSTSDIKQDEDGVTVHLTVYEQEQFDAKEVQSLEKGDILIFDGETVVVSSMEKDSDGSYTITDKEGVEYSLVKNSDGNSYYELGVSDSLNYISVGATDLPLSVDFIYKDQSNLNEKGRTATQEDFKEIAEEYQTTFSAADTTATVKNGEVTVINKAYRP